MPMFMSVAIAATIVLFCFLTGHIVKIVLIVCVLFFDSVCPLTCFNYNYIIIIENTDSSNCN